MTFLESITAELNAKYKTWSFDGDIVAWYQSGGQRIIKAVLVITQDVQTVVRWKHRGKNVVVRPGKPTGAVLSPDKMPNRHEVKTPTLAASPPAKSCPHRGEQIDTILCDQCGQGKGQLKPVHACAIHGRCTHRLERRGQDKLDPPTWVCIGCKDGPWAP